MQKPFEESLKDGFRHITNITDPKLLNKLREESILVDDEGYYTFEFGDNKEYSLNVEPVSGEGVYRIVLYKNKIPLTEPLYMKSL